MHHRPVPILTLVLCLYVMLSASCVVRRRVINRPGGGTKQALAVADKATLVDRVAKVYSSVHNFSATVDMTPALGSAEKSKITEYKDVRGFILFRKPDDIRIIGLFPVVRNKAFDMVSDGKQFRLYIPSRSRFITGSNEIIEPSANKLENLRPQHFVDALLVRPPENPHERAVLENLTDEDTAQYILHLIVDAPGSSPRLSRSIWFDRIGLRLARQIIYDDTGNILTDARYSEWQSFDGVPFPKQVSINRPRDEYAVVLTVVKMDINKGVKDEQFVLDQPPGSTLQVLGRKPAETPPAAPAAPKERKKK